MAPESLRDEGAGQQSATRSLVRTAVTKAALGNPSLSLLKWKQRRLPVGVHRLRPVRLEIACGQRVRFPYGNASGHNFVATQYMTDCRLEYMVHHPRVAGSSPATSAYKHRRCSSNGRAAYISGHNLVGHVYNNTNIPTHSVGNDTHSTAGVEYMVLQVRFPPDPLRNTSMGPDLVIRACAVSQGFALPHNFVEC